VFCTGTAGAQQPFFGGVRRGQLGSKSAKKKKKALGFVESMRLLAR
jgi:hypothetical protein